MKLTVVGCTGSFPGPESPASCYLLEAQQDGRRYTVLFDLGSGALGAVQRYVDLREIDAVFLSHLHPDHCMDVCGLHVAVHWDPRGFGGKRIAIYGPAETAERMALAYGMPSDPGMHEDFDFHALSPQTPVQLGPLSIYPFAVRHPVEEAFAFRVEEKTEDGGIRVMTYSGDTDSCPELIQAARGADLFLCEAAYQEGRDDEISGVHLTGRRAAEAASEAEVKTLLLTHLPVWNDPQVSLDEAERAFDGPCELARAGAHYTI